MQILKSRTVFTPYSQDGSAATEGCTAVMFINEGDVTIKIKGLITIVPGDSWAVNQVTNNRLDFTDYQFSFDLSHTSTTGTNKLLVVVQVGLA